MERIGKICSYIDRCKTFADIGCDHGYCTQYALRKGLCERAYITDISAKCLKKAEKLLADYIESGVCVPICCDGLEGIDKDCGQVLIAGMGGEEIIRILENSFIPEKFIFQPMKSAPELRKFLIERGCAITADDIFFDGKYYFIIKGERTGGTSPYSEKELTFGRGSLKNPLVKGYAAAEAEKRRAYLGREMKDENRAKLLVQYRMYMEVAQGDD